MINVLNLGLCIWDAIELKPIEIIKFHDPIKQVVTLPNDTVLVMLEGKEPYIAILHLGPKPSLSQTVQDKYKSLTQLTLFAPTSTSTSISPDDVVTSVALKMD